MEDMEEAVLEEQNESMRGNCDKNSGSGVHGHERRAAQSKTKAGVKFERRGATAICKTMAGLPIAGLDCQDKYK
eukprot:15923001-Heterocapsa_arctica.AAC.1